MILPPPKTTAKLFVTGSTVGPLVDALHNQCLLEYDILPIQFSVGSSHSLICTSWVIPPLLGFAYVVLGGVLPRLCSTVLGEKSSVLDKITDGSSLISFTPRDKAVLAVLSTALIIRLSEYLQTNSYTNDEISSSFNFLVMSVTALFQWVLLDGTTPALVAALITAYGGPLSELPFIANGFWHYIPSAADYLPLLSFPVPESWQNLSLSSITGPCYFAVTMDSIALGRWFDSGSSHRFDDKHST